MASSSTRIHALRSAIELPCGAVLKNRIAKSPMSDSLADGEGNPTEAQIRLYERWGKGGPAVSLIGEVQGDHRFPERPGNLVLGENSDRSMLEFLTHCATSDGTHLWAQIGHAGALAHLPISQPKGPSPLSVGGLQCGGFSTDEIADLPQMYAKTALLAKTVGFTGVQVHAGHGFLLSQFLSSLFNHRTDQYGGSLEARCSIILEIIDRVRHAVGPLFPIGIRINSSDQLEGGLTEIEALEVVRLLDRSSVDLIDISGGTYFPGAKASSDAVANGPYFVEFARRAKGVTSIPIMVTGGFKRREEAAEAIASGATDMVGLARAMVLNPCLAHDWLRDDGGDPKFPKFVSSPPGGITAWYTMRLTALSDGKEGEYNLDPDSANRLYEERDAMRCVKWNNKFSKQPSASG